ncbi:uncharacterized protein N7458_007273 [Penicillium daleae]|uniref:GH18 domain-containing protein n=1 Tax=Penicillium daleae TaxID=63821 RepID=A0AAD6C0S7_9EURO|nr:uncharacterized protein N7458_007273 [Penicillium daleae]KAJ5443401.1 hypothetical protein N7458_007273 [Penicillium daleae]
MAYNLHSVWDSNDPGLEWTPPVRLPYLNSPTQTLAIYLQKAALRDLVLIALEFYLTKVCHVLLKKVDYANLVYLGGVMIWVVNQDTYN